MPAEAVLQCCPPDRAASLTAAPRRAAAGRLCNTHLNKHQETSQKSSTSHCSPQHRGVQALEGAAVRQALQQQLVRGHFLCQRLQTKSNETKLSVSSGA